MQGPDTEAQDQPPPFFHFRLATHGRSIQLGQMAKYSSRVDVFRFSSDTGRRSFQLACPFGTKRGHSGEFSLNSETSAA